MTLNYDIQSHKYLRKKPKTVEKNHRELFEKFGGLKPSKNSTTKELTLQYV